MGADAFGLEFRLHVREACQGAVHFEHVADDHNTLGGVGADAPVVKPAELVAVQPKRRGSSQMQALSKGIDSRRLKASTWTGHRHGVRSTHLSEQREVLVLIVSQRATRPLISPVFPCARVRDLMRDLSAESV